MPAAVSSRPTTRGAVGSAELVWSRTTTRRDGLSQLLRERARGILVDRAEEELPPVGGPEPERLALLAAGSGHGA